MGNQNQQNSGNNRNNMMNNLLPLAAMDGDVKDIMIAGALTGGLNGQNNRQNPVLQNSQVQPRNQQPNVAGELFALEMMDGVGDNLGAMYMMNEMNNHNSGTSGGNNSNMMNA